MPDLIVRGGRVIDPAQSVDSVGTVFVSGGRIQGMEFREPQAAPEGYRVIEAQKMLVCPGFIDLHCHLRQPGYEEKETILTGTCAAAGGGFTTVCCMPNTRPPVDSKDIVGHIKEIAEKQGAVRVFPIGCISVNRAGKKLADFGELSASGVVAFSDDGSPVEDDPLLRSALEHSRETGLPIIDHCEDPALSRDGVMNAGSLADRLGLPGIPAESEENIVARDLKIARSTGGRLHIAHVSTAGTVELIRHAREEGVDVTAEVTPHHLVLTEEAVIKHGTKAKVNPPLRTAKDTESLLEGLKDGVIDAIATDHAPHTGRDKSVDFRRAAFGISGFETAFGVLMQLVHTGGIDLVTLVARLTSGPARVIKRDIGSLRPGAPADIVIIDPQTEWVVDPALFVSKGRNTPFEGSLLKGKVVMTIAGGKIVYSDSLTTASCLGRPEVIGG